MITLLKSKGAVFVAEYDEKKEEDREELERLQRTYGNVNTGDTDVVHHRTYYVDEREIEDGVDSNGDPVYRTVKIPYFNQTGLNRHGRRQQASAMARDPLHGQTKTNAQSRTKHKRTRAEIKQDRAHRKMKQRN